MQLYCDVPLLGFDNRQLMLFAYVSLTGKVDVLIRLRILV